MKRPARVAAFRLAAPLLALTIALATVPGGQPGAGELAPLPLTLVLVADVSRMKGAEKDPAQRPWIWADAGFISQNVYLFCASAGLATGVRALVDG